MKGQLEREQEAYDLARQFLAELDTCKTEQDRVYKVLELVHGVARGARDQQEQEEQ